MKDFCIIGSGNSGATIANALRKKYSLDVYDKARGVGGRSSNKKLNMKESFDHGVQYISPKSIEFKKFIKDLIRKKIDNCQENSMMATNLNDLIAYSEEIYTEYIGIIRPRVVVSGKKEFLEKNSSLIRALLLSGIRAAFLWNHYGGSKWQLMFRRKEILNKCENFFI